MKTTLALLLLLVPAACGAEDSRGCNYWLISHASDSPFWAVVKKGAQDAALALGCTVQFYMASGDLNAQRDGFMRALSAKPDGIALSISNDKLFDDPVAKALDSGVPVVGVNNDDSRGSAGNRRLCYIGQDDENAAYRLGLLLIEAAQKKGFSIFDTQTVLFSELPGSNFDAKRSAGISRALGEFGMKPPKVVDLGNRRDEYERRLESYLDADGGRIIVVTLGSSATESLYGALKATGRRPGDIVAGGFDVAQNTIEGIKNGYMVATVDQQQYLQGYYSVYSLWLYNKYGFAADVDTGRSIIDNPVALEQISRLSKQHIR